MITKWMAFSLAGTLIVATASLYTIREDAMKAVKTYSERAAMPIGGAVDSGTGTLPLSEKNKAGSRAIGGRLSESAGRTIIDDINTAPVEGSAARTLSPSFVPIGQDGTVDRQADMQQYGMMAGNVYDNDDISGPSDKIDTDNSNKDERRGDDDILPPQFPQIDIVPEEEAADDAGDQLTSPQPPQLPALH